MADRSRKGIETPTTAVRIMAAVSSADGLMPFQKCSRLRIDTNDDQLRKHQEEVKARLLRVRRLAVQGQEEDQLGDGGERAQDERK